MSKRTAATSGQPDKISTKSTRVLIVDDHELMRDGLRDLIHTQAGWQVCGEAVDASEALRQLGKTEPNLVIVDLTLKNSNGLDLIRRIKQTSSAARVLVLSMHDEKLYAERALRAGADGFVNKQQPSRVILNAIRVVLSGDVYLSKKMSDTLLRRVGALKAEIERSPVEQLSDRELEVFRLVGEGLTTDEIAKRLHLSLNTIGTYRERLKTKLNLQTAAELSRAATQWSLENR